MRHFYLRWLGWVFSIACLFAAFAASAADVEMPRVLDERLTIELFADAPQIVTPTGIAVDGLGRVYVIECHTHFPPEGYEGPKTDRIKVYEDTDGDGRADKITTAFEGTKATMNMALDPENQWLYVATRSEIFRLKFNLREGTLGEREKLAHLETKGDYPHNGLSGFAFDFAGDVFFGFGENLGADYNLIGSDGKTLLGGGEGGNIYRCRPDGRELHKVATGFWNPFHLCFDTFGRLFAVDNDPDSRPPCRLLHIVEDGDYGYRFRNGRKGLHPFTAWNGELPGTLPMVAGTGEAPSGILAYESDNLPEDYLGNLLCTSWGDHRIDRFRLKPHGSSFLSTAEPVIVGGENFRPVGIALAPDGSLYVSDWVDKSYQLHGKGRIWRVKAARAREVERPEDPRQGLYSLHRPLREKAVHKIHFKKDSRDFLRKALHDRSNVRAQVAALWSDELRSFLAGGSAEDMISLIESESGIAPAVARLIPDSPPLSNRRSARANDDARRNKDSERLELAIMNTSSSEAAAELVRFFWTPEDPYSELFERCTTSSDPFLRRAMLTAFKRSRFMDDPKQDWSTANSPAVRLLALLYFRELHPIDKRPLELLTKSLDDPDPDVRFAAVQWAAEEGLKQFRPNLAEGLSTQATTRRLFEGYLAGIAMLDGNATKTWDETGLEPYMAELLLDAKTAPAVRRRALRMLRPDHPALTTEVLRGMLALDDPGMQQEVVRTLRERSQADARELLRSLAANVEQPTALRSEAVVGLRASDPEDRKLLWSLVDERVHPLHDEALRSLRGVELTHEERQRLAAVKSDEPDTKELVAWLLDPLAVPDGAPGVGDGPAWLALLDKQGKGDAAAGERIFFHAQAAGCYKCHQMEGRGGRVGPDLTATGKMLSRQRLIESVLRPSQEVAPQFVTWTIVTHDGRSLTGVLTGEAVDGTQTYADAEGKHFTVKPAEIETREQAKKSIMPDGLHQRLTLRELCDLLAYLGEGR